jgi:hypothetical protein
MFKPWQADMPAGIRVVVVVSIRPAVTFPVVLLTAKDAALLDVVSRCGSVLHQKPKISKVKPLSHLFLSWLNGDILQNAAKLFLSVGTLAPSSAAPMLPNANWNLALPGMNIGRKLMLS